METEIRNDLSYADGAILLAILLAKSKEVKSKKIKMVSETSGFRLTTKKTMVVSNFLLCEFIAVSEEAKVVETFLSFRNKDRMCQKGNSTRKIVTNLGKIVKVKYISTVRKIRMVNEMVFPLLKDFCEIWTMRNTERKSGASELSPAFDAFDY